jgi:transcriptional regulator with XRE-family HTH domain
MFMNEIPAINMVATGQRITELRQASGMSVRELQDVFGFATPQAIYKWQRGTAMPTIDNLVALSVIFGVTIDDIIVLDECLYAISA